MFLANPIPLSSVVVRRERLAAVGGFAPPVRAVDAGDPWLGLQPQVRVDDWDLWLRLCADGSDAVCVPDAVVGYRRHPGQMTADVAGLARAQLDLHAAFADLAGPGGVQAARATDLAALAAGLARERDVPGALRAWAAVRELRPLTAGEWARVAALRVPGLRRRVGRGEVY